MASRTTLGVPLALLNRAATESGHLQGLYDAVTASIRSVDLETLIFYEPVNGGGGNSGEGFKSVPGGPSQASKSVLSFHSYGPNAVDRDEIEAVVEKRLNLVQKLGGGLMASWPSSRISVVGADQPAPQLTEFDVEYTKGIDHLMRVFDLADRSLLSWIGSASSPLCCCCRC